MTENKKSECQICFKEFPDDELVQTPIAVGDKIEHKRACRPCANRNQEIWEQTSKDMQDEAIKAEIYKHLEEATKQDGFAVFHSATGEFISILNSSGRQIEPDKEIIVGSLMGVSDPEQKNIVTTLVVTAVQKRSRMILAGPRYIPMETHPTVQLDLHLGQIECSRCNGTNKVEMVQQQSKEDVVLNLHACKANAVEIARINHDNCERPVSDDPQ